APAAASSGCPLRLASNASPGVSSSGDVQELVPVLGDRGCAGKVRLDHLDEPGLVRGEAVPVKEPLQIGEQKPTLASQRDDAAVDPVEASSQRDRRQPR